MSAIRDQVTELLNQEMDRKRFLQFSGAAFLAAFGVSGLITALLSVNKNKPAASNTMTGYGSSRFGKSK